MAASQWAMGTGSFDSRSTARVAPPKMVSRIRLWPWRLSLLIWIMGNAFVRLYQE